MQYEVSVPADWDKDMVEFHRNESSWCAGSLVDELGDMDSEPCLCCACEFRCITIRGDVEEHRRPAPVDLDTVPDRDFRELLEEGER